MEPILRLRTSPLERVRTRTARVGVVGMGYVGLSLARAIYAAGFSVLGFETDRGRQREAKEALEATSGISDMDPVPMPSPSRLDVFNNPQLLSKCDVILVCVQTPLDPHGNPDLSALTVALQSIRVHLGKGVLVVLESTSFPGTTEEFALPLLENETRTVGQDFFLCSSPERIDPGVPGRSPASIPKVVGGVTSQCMEFGTAFYAEFVDAVIPAPSARIAEMAKLLENTFRMVNIALINEIAQVCDRMDVDVWEVVRAASSKPFGFMPFYPGPGPGGHCIPVDPIYLSWKARQAGARTELIDIANSINATRPAYVAGEIAKWLESHGLGIRGIKVHVFGVTYKPDVPDTRGSAAIEIMERLSLMGATLSYTDPYVPALTLRTGVVHSQPIESDQIDCAVIANGHAEFNFSSLIAMPPLIVDLQNIIKNDGSDKLLRL